MANKKISKVNLSGESYEIDVAKNLKATNILSTDKDQISKVATVEAVQKPDGVNALFDENNKISSSYLSDTILGQLKFGGSLYLSPEDPTGVPNLCLSINPSAALYGAFQEYLNNLENFDNSWVVMEPGLKLKFQVSTDSGFEQHEWNFCCSYGELSSGHPELTVKFPTSICEGYYFIAGTDLSAVYYSAKYGAFGSSYSEDYPTMVLAETHVGDWQVVSNGNLVKIDNTDTITHIKDSYTSLLSIEGAGLKLNGFTNDNQRIKFDKPLTHTDSKGNELILGAQTANGVNGLYFNPSSGEQSYFKSSGISTPKVSANTVIAKTKMTAPTITDTEDKTQVVNLDYFENNATKVDWENIDSEVHVINDHNVEIDGGLIVHGKTDDNILEVTSSQIEDVSSTEITSLGVEVSCSFEPYVPVNDVEHPRWVNDGEEFEGLGPLIVPYWVSFPVKTNNLYKVIINSATSRGFAGPEYFTEINSADQLVVFAPTLGGTLSCVPYTYHPTEQDNIYGRYGNLTFTATQDGFAYVAFNNSTSFGGMYVDTCAFIYEKPLGSPAKVKVSGDLEVTGDLSFGADSHIVFGTIEGTDFIADYAKVKNVPVEDDDVVNKAYFDANKGSGGGSLPSGATEGAFLRYKSGAAVWEVIPIAEDSAF